MHRADVELCRQIELSFIEHGFTPTRGVFVHYLNTNNRCGLGSLAGPRYEHACDCIDVAYAKGCHPTWVSGFQAGFDGHLEPFKKFYERLLDCDEDDFGPQWIRGFKAGWSVASRVFAAAPVESVPVPCVTISSGANE